MAAESGMMEVGGKEREPGTDAIESVHVRVSYGMRWGMIWELTLTIFSALSRASCTMPILS